MTRLRRVTSTVSLLFASIGGLLAFFYPFLLAAAGYDPGPTRGIEVPLLFAALAFVSLIVLVTGFADDEGILADPARTIAVLAVLVAVDSLLRFVPSLIGASPIFLLIVLSGYVFGARFGFLMGTLTLLVSAALTGGIGPWLPFQMLAAGWMGLTASWLPRWRGWPRRLALVVLGVLWGFAFGALMNLWFWPFAAPGVAESGGIYWTPGMTLSETIAAYTRFYFATSLLFDGTRALGNAALLLLLGEPLVMVLERWKVRSSWHPWYELPTG
jgi:energy-coupling factor transport system substrate-specific component